MNVFSYLLKTFFLLFRHCLNLVCFLKSGKHLSRSATIRLSMAVSAEECIEFIHSFIRGNGSGSLQYVQLLHHHSCIRKSLLPEPFSSNGLCFLLKFPETVRAEEEDQVGLQAPENPHDSSTDTCLTFPYSSNSPRSFPPSPVHSVTDSSIRVSPLFIATSNSSSNNSPVHRSISHNSPAPASSTPPNLASSEKLSLLFFLLKLLIPPIILSILPTFLVPSPMQDLQYFLEVLLNFPTLGSHSLGLVLPFLQLPLFLPILYLPGLLLLLNPHLSFLLGLSP